MRTLSYYYTDARASLIAATASLTLTLAVSYWIQYRVAGKTCSMVVVFKPERCLVPRDAIGIALGFQHAKFDVTRGQLEVWLRAKGYVLRGPVMEAE